MAKFAPVAPVSVVRQLQAYNAGDYHLLLAHDVAANAPAYTSYFKGFKNTIIMDNSVIELGNAVDLNVIKRACNAVDPTSIVLPDVLLDGKKTVASCRAALDNWDPAFADIFGKRHDRGFMLVPQGKTLDEFAWCAQQFAEDSRVNFWGVPRNLVAEIGSRSRAIDIVSILNPTRRIHMLGFSDDICDDVICASDRRVEGIDSAVPLRVAQLGIPMTLDLDAPPRSAHPKGQWWDHAEHCILMDENIALYKSWIRRR